MKKNRTKVIKALTALKESAEFRRAFSVNFRSLPTTLLLDLEHVEEIVSGEPLKHSQILTAEKLISLRWNEDPIGESSLGWICREPDETSFAILEGTSFHSLSKDFPDQKPEAFIWLIRMDRKIYSRDYVQRIPGEVSHSFNASKRKKKKGNFLVLLF